MSKEIILDENAFLVSETDERGIITFASDDFCKIAEYSVEELIGQPHNIVRHADMPKEAFKDLWDTVKRGKTWKGFVKNSTKKGNYYWVYATVYQKKSRDGKISFLSCRRKATKEEIDSAEKIYKLMK